MKIIIEVDAQGNLGMSGDLGNRMFVYGALELAKEALSHNAFRQADKLIQPATLVPPSNLFGGGN